ncbi:hypothetical protein [Arthrobacter bambusae]|nr:hypothetical protein [Arthrobacter bambusae]MDQ0028543.1 hypothetical protein [Arthrobacter bambusae]MDQ0096663.1 hypothetical protein [Arthrobacter bambusae]
MAAFFGPTESGSRSFDEILARYLQGQRVAGPGHPMMKNVLWHTPRRRS